MGSFSARAAGKDTLLETLTKRLSSEVMTTLASTRGVRITGGRSIDQITTKSFEAYTHFARGIDMNNAGDFGGAIPELERAVAIDPGMGSAWSELACGYSFLNQSDRARAASNRAMALRDHMNRRERLWVEANAKWVDGEPGEAVRARLQRYLQEFPDDRQAQFYIGQWHLVHGRTGMARESFEAARSKGITMFIEHVGAGFELARLPKQ